MNELEKIMKAEAVHNEIMANKRSQKKIRVVTLF
jgi:hypothetical protein